MAIATTDATGLPDVRMVLLKHADADGFVFYTNTQSQKGLQLTENMQAAGRFALEIAAPSNSLPGSG